MGLLLEGIVQLRDKHFETSPHQKAMIPSVLKDEQLIAILRVRITCIQFCPAMMVDVCECLFETRMESSSIVDIYLQTLSYQKCGFIPVKIIRSTIDNNPVNYNLLIPCHTA